MKDFAIVIEGLGEPIVKFVDLDTMKYRIRIFNWLVVNRKIQVASKQLILNMILCNDEENDPYDLSKGYIINPFISEYGLPRVIVHGAFVPGRA